MKAWPRISIITPSYNQGQYIEDTINSVVNQNYPNLEYIIIDGGSTDNTIEIIKKYEQHIKYWISEPDKGQSHAINKGLKIATGDIVNWLNSDDYLEPEALRNIAKAFLRSSKVDIVSGSERILYPGGTSIVKPGTLVFPSFEETLFYSFIYQPSTFWHRKVIEEIGHVNEHLHYLMDAELYMKYLSAFGKDNIVKIDSILANFRVHDTSKTVTSKHKFEQERWQLRLSLLQSVNGPAYLIDTIKKNILESEEARYPIHQPICDKHLYYLYENSLVRKFYHEEKYPQARKVFFRWMKYTSLVPINDLIKYFVRVILLPEFFIRGVRRLKNINYKQVTTTKFDTSGEIH